MVTVTVRGPHPIYFTLNQMKISKWMRETEELGWLFSYVAPLPSFPAELRMGEKLFRVYLTSTLLETNSSPLKIGLPNRKGSYSNHPFLGAKILVSGRVIFTIQAVWQFFEWHQLYIWRSFFGKVRVFPLSEARQWWYTAENERMSPEKGRTFNRKIMEISSWFWGGHVSFPGSIPKNSIIFWYQTPKPMNILKWPRDPKINGCFWFP